MVVGWDGLVTAAHNDAAAERLLKHLVVDRYDPADTISRTMTEVGPDPAFGSTLRLYPGEEVAFLGPYALALPVTPRRSSAAVTPQLRSRVLPTIVTLLTAPPSSGALAI